MDPQSIKEIGTNGAVVIGLLLIVRQVVAWMQGRIDYRDAQLDERHTQLINLTRQTVEFIVDSKRVNEELIEAIRKMSGEICTRLLAIEGQHLTPKGM